jgi:hypothetical protein
MATMTKNSKCFYVPMNDDAYPIDLVRATLKNVLTPLGIRFTVRERENDKMGEYASISVTTPAARSRKRN